MSFRDNGAVSGAIYYYRVCAINADGAGQFSVSASGRIGAGNDFDGDAISEVWRFVGENWYVWMSGTAYRRSGPFRFSVGDFDGDGRADLALARDYDRDGKVDPAVIDASGNCHYWQSSRQYQYSGPYPLPAP